MSGSSKKVVLLFALIALIGVGAVLYHKHHESVQASASAAARAAPAARPAAQMARTKEQAIDALMALPELKAWSAHIAKVSGGSAHGALLDDDGATKLVHGKSYWSLSFVENSQEAAHRWETFLVATQGDEILVDDMNDDRQLTLAQWRADMRPMDRIAKKAAPETAPAPAP
ncbi:hypothetical protein IV454_01765 [Massilia antarctica]|uniref:Uncharacterized protein n=1 Tax=Massilia antarctica TaxID=2765360 RepID=A0AA48WD06_9BURK|nr:hypothetical protein [Massilia antarctica]QPI50385.1 hypothetical protein IV454_01765 [Massilia antarctica]